MPIRNPHQKALGNVGWVEVDEVWERIVGVIGLVGRPHVLVVGDNDLRTGVVWVS